MRTLKLLLIGLLLGANAPADNGLVGLQREDQRILAIAYRLQRANAELCDNKGPLTGFLLHDINQYAPPVRAEAGRVFGIANRPGVLAVAPGSPASKAGLKPNDVITDVNGVQLLSGTARNATFDSVRRAEAIVERAMSNPPLRFGREGKAAVSFRPENGCLSRVLVVPGKKLNAKADGEIVEITTGLIAFAGNDDAIATVLAHELAHNILGHRTAIKEKRLNVRETEVEADDWSMYLLIRAGFDGDKAVDFWERFEARTNKGFLADGTHPGKKERLRLVRSVLAEIRVLQREGMPLVPKRMIFNTKR